MKGFIFVGIFISCLLLSFLIHKDTIKYLFEWENTILPTRIEWLIYALLCTVLILNIEDLFIFIENLVIFSKISLFCSFANLIFYINGQIEELGYMVFSYDMLIPLLTIFYYGIKNNRLSYKFICILGIMAIFIFGSRGAFLSAIIGMLLIYFSFGNKKRKRYIIIFAILFFGLFIKNSNMESMSSLIKNGRMPSRTITMLANSEIFNTTGRSDIARILIPGISLSGHGLFSDRNITSLNGFMDSTYAHNFILEILIEFGVVIGLPILIIFYITSLWIMFSEGSHIKDLAVIFFPSAIIKLLFTGSYLNIEPGFYVFIGLMLKQISLANKKSIQNNESSMVM